MVHLYWSYRSDKASVNLKKTNNLFTSLWKIRNSKEPSQHFRFPQYTLDCELSKLHVNEGILNFCSNYILFEVDCKVPFTGEKHIPWIHIYRTEKITKTLSITNKILCISLSSWLQNLVHFWTHKSRNETIRKKVKMKNQIWNAS